MKIGFVLLSDLHLEKNNHFLNIIGSFKRAVITALAGCEHCFIVFSGDITKNASVEQFNLAYDLLLEIQNSILKDLPYCEEVNFVLVPGNHDCVLRNDSENDRKRWIDSVIRQDENITDSIKFLLSSQDNFWHFFSKLKNSQIPSNKICYQEYYDIKGKKVAFNCYNTALCSTLHDELRNLSLPEFELNKIKEDYQSDIVISVFHHNTSYITNDHYNRKNFIKHLENNSDIIFCGHEHRDEEKIISDLKENRKTIYIESGNLGPNDSEFVIFFYDDETNSINKNSFKFNYGNNNNVYEFGKGIDISLLNYRKIITNDFLKDISYLKIPFTHIKKIKLHDIYVYPDLNDLSCDKYFSADLLLNGDFSVAIIKGEEQSGKTSLLNMFFIELLKRSLFPLLIDGNKIDKNNIEKKSFKKEYNENIISYSEYEQKDKKDKILLVDNLQLDQIELPKLKKNLLKKLECYSKIIITSNYSFNVTTDQLIESSSEIKARLYSIKKFGFKKRNRLISKFVNLEYPELIGTSEQSRRVSELFEKTSTFLGHQLVPSYPFFIISFLDNMRDLSSFDLSRTTYAFCYRSMITNSLLNNKVSDDKIEGVFQFISFLAYKLYVSKKSCDCSFFCNVYSEYNNDYLPSYDLFEMQNKLEQSKILVKQGGYFDFQYKYIFYYFVSYYISNASDKELNDFIEHLLDNIHNEAEANIFIFLVNQRTLSKKSIEWLVFNTCLPFEKYPPITLKEDDVLFNVLNEIQNYIRVTSVNISKDPDKEKEKLYQKIDEYNDRHSQSSEDIHVQDPAFIDLKKSLKLIKIIGQIVKNQKNVFKKEDLIDLIEHSYLVAFRILSYSVTLFEKSKDSITLEVINQLEKSGNKWDEAKIRSKISRIFNVVLYRLCLQIFGTLANSLGMRHLDFFKIVDNKINTPASRIIGFYIDTLYNYNDIDFNELKKILHDYKKNQVIIQIVNRRISNFVYYTPLRDKTIQQLESITKLRFIRKF